MEKPVIIAEWQGLEGEFVPKSSNWYWTVGILSLGSAVAALIAGNFLFSVVLLLSGFTVSLVGSRRPAMHTFRITDRGVHVSTQIFPWANIQKFAIKEEEPRKLLFELKEGLVRIMTIPLMDTDRTLVRTEFKNRNVEEVERLDSLASHLADWMGLG